mmetsp:Transcript_15047/g.39057  ORF Transcript_15047/g.39057 Transcript_15047/m.39057 type:complete len:212 (-) Transcript_15047:682-1317(-)
MRMSLMSSPRAATSVAIKIGARPDLNSKRTRSRSRCSLSPWIALHGICRRSAMHRSSHMRLVEQKISTRAPGPPCFMSVSMSLRSLSNSVGVSSTICWMSLLAVGRSPPEPIVICAGERWNSEASRRTSGGQVAVNIIVCRCGGTCAMMRRICGSKPMSSIRSASSSTRYPTEPSITCLASRKSFRRPGVAITTYTPRCKSRSCWPFGAPP